MVVNRGHIDTTLAWDSRVLCGLATVFDPCVQTRMGNETCVTFRSSVYSDCKSSMRHLAPCGASIRHEGREFIACQVDPYRVSVFARTCELLARVTGRRGPHQR